MDISLILDLVLVIFLAVTIGYAVVLNKRLGSLRRDKDILEKMAVNFHASTERAEQSIVRLKKSGENLMTTLNKAETLRDDLVFLSERGGLAADRLENAIRLARGQADEQKNPKNPDLQTGNKKPETQTMSKKIKFSDIVDNDLKQSETKNNDIQKSDEAGKKISEVEKELLRALRSAN